MSLPVKGFENKKDRKSSFLRQVTPLNPNAVEFFPSSLRSAHGNSKTNILEVPETSTKVVLDRSDSATSTNSDDEAGQFWLHQLPEDITPDFTVTEDSSSTGKLLLSGLSIYDEEATRVSASMSGQLWNSQVSNGLTQKFRYSSSLLPQYQSTAFVKSATGSRDNRFIKSDDHLNYEFDGRDSKGISGAEFANYLYDNHPIMEDSAINHVQFLALQFPGFSVDRLADLYYANARDLNLTIEILTQLELQVDAGIAENQNSSVLESPSSRTNFPPHIGAVSQNSFPRYNRDNMHKNQTFDLCSSTVFRGAPDFISAVGNLASQNNGTWKPERNDPMSPVGGSNVNSQLLNIAYESQAKLIFDNKLQGFGSAGTPPVWLESGEPVENTYSASRWDPRDYARLHNACFQQAREAYLIGNKVLAKKLGDKGKWYNLQIKEAHAKAREAVHRQRKPFSFELQDNARGQDRIIDLHGLHANEALLVLKHELGLLRNAARSGGHWLQMLICVGTSHHTNGAQTPAKLPTAVDQYLSDEGILHAQPQPGLFRAIIYP